MNNIVRNKSVLSKALTGASIVALVFALNVSGAFAGFWRLASEANPTQFLYGFGSNENNLFSYGYGYGYGYGDFNAGYAVASSSSSSSSSGGSGGGGSSSGGSTGVGLPVYDASTGETTTGIDTPTVDTDNSGDTNTTDSNTDVFSDISANWAKDYINTLSDLGIVDGNTDGAFEPERAITRAEFLKMSLRAFGYTYDSSDAASMTFSDVDASHWTANVIGRGQELGIVDGFGAGAFRPNDMITRGEAMKMLVLTAGFAVDASATSSYADVVDAWQVKYIEAAKNLGIVTAATNFRPNEAITRAETAKVISLGMSVAAQ